MATAKPEPESGRLEFAAGQVLSGWELNVPLDAEASERVRHLLEGAGIGVEGRVRRTPFETVR